MSDNLKNSFERLPQNVVPKHYYLELSPDLNNFVFDGTVAVKLEVVSSTKEIVLNSVDLEIQKVTLKQGSGVEQHPTDIVISVDDETATLKFDNDIAAGEATLQLEFKGVLNDKLKGFYRSKYTDLNGIKKYAAVTQFATTDARRCFPCWDEPAIKATFEISVRAEGNKVVLSNMPIVSEARIDGDRKLVKFDKTPIMSTYLVAVVVGEFDYVEEMSEDGVLIRVYTPLGRKEEGRFSLKVASKALPYYKSYFNIAYPLPKMDLIAIADFSYGAMENWGLVTYRELKVLVDPENVSAVTKQAVALVVCHELAHQWFGNLVTMEWWTHIWLNEGYASFTEFLCVDHLFPEYDIWSQFLTESYIRALELDRLNTSHPIEVAVHHPSEVDEVLDAISYNKGASIIRMLHNYIGDDAFRKGMNLYLTRHQYGNTQTEDLWAALGEASQEPVGAVMSTWTKQMGFPVIRMEFEQRDCNRVMILTQDKFNADGSKGPEDALWMVPIAISTQENPKQVWKTIMLKNREQEVIMENVSPTSWVKLNSGTIGYYRTCYSDDILNQFKKAIQNNEFLPLDRLGLMDDFFALVQTGHKETASMLRYLEAFSDETDHTVWLSISKSFQKILMMFGDSSDKLKSLGRRLFSKVYKRVGWESKKGESHLDTLLRSAVINMMIKCKDQDALEAAVSRFHSSTSGEKHIAADLKSACYRGALTSSNSNVESVLSTLLSLYKTTDSHEEKDRIAKSLGAIEDADLLDKVLQFGISENVRSQDTIYFMQSVSTSLKGARIAWTFLKDNWTIFLDKFQGSVLLGRLIKCVAENLSSKDDSADVKDFFIKHPISGTERAVEQSIEIISLHADWIDRYRLNPY